jgi:hypothetical protein
MADSMLVQTEDPGLAKDQELVSWVMSRVQRWRQFRDSEHSDHWTKYYCLWKGDWSPLLKGKQSERSRLIAPALQQAVDQTVAEMVEATFGKSTWFDISDDVDPQQRALAEQSRDQLIKDFDRDGIAHDVREAFVNGAIYGTGIAKRNIEEVEDSVLEMDPITGTPAPKAIGTRVKVTWEAVNPRNFVIDTAASSIEDALGVAHETIRPLHEVQAKQRSGEYYSGPVETSSNYTTTLLGADGKSLAVDHEDGVFITEYHGLVPERLIYKRKKDEDPLKDYRVEDGDKDGDTDSEELCEAIVTIGNGGTLLKAVKNEFLYHDRGWVAYPHDIVPNSFWGRGVCEKGYNAQAALDAELRARIDALGLLTYPVVGADATRLPRNLNLQITPGKVFMTNGRPSEIIEPLKFGNLDASTFQQSGDLERMVQMATGAVDTATPIDVNSRNSTATGTSMIAGAVIKRAKLSMHNVDALFLDPMVRKSLLVLHQLDPERYPIDVEFTVNSTMSIMAREYEQTQMTNLLAIVPQESPAFLTILKAIVENYSGPSKDKILAEIEKMQQPSNDPMQQQLQQIQAQGAMVEIQKLQAEIQQIAANIELIRAKTMAEVIKAEYADDEVEIKAAQTVIDNKYADIQAMQARQSAMDKHQDRQMERERMAHDRDKSDKDRESKEKQAANKPKPTNAK